MLIVVDVHPEGASSCEQRLDVAHCVAREGVKGKDRRGLLVWVCWVSGVVAVVAAGG
jgi:hypothetical protein